MPVVPLDPSRRPLLRSAALVVAFLLAVLVGRVTRLPGSELALVWPAAAVGFLWLAGSWSDRRALRRDVLLLALATWVGNAVTGAGPGEAGAFALSNVLLAGVTCWTVQRLHPGSWCLRTPRDLLVLVLASTAGAVASAPVGPVVVWLADGADPRLVVPAWVVRNAASTFVFGALALRLADPAARLRPGRRLLLEAAAAAAALCAGYQLVFGTDGGLPLGFALLPLSLLVALRLGATLAAVHVLLAGAFVLHATLGDSGPFAVGSPVARVLLAQSFVAVVGLVSLALALFRDERAALLQRSEADRAASAQQAAFLDTLLQTLGVGVVACDAEGRVSVVNRAARELHDDWTGTAGLRGEDGCPLDPGLLPLQRALRQGVVSGAVVVVTAPGRPERVVRCDGLRMQDADGRSLGAVLALQDVTAARAAQRELQERERRFRAAFHDSPTAIAYCSLGGEVREVNAALRRALGLSTTRLLGRQLGALVHPDDRARLQSRLDGAGSLDGGRLEPLEVRVLRVDGVALWCELTVTLCREAQAGDAYLLVQLLDVDARKSNELALERAARVDRLTGLGNRAALDAELARLLDPVRGGGAALLLLDLDGFKPVNDTHGHDAGDAVLREVAGRLRGAVRPEDVVARLGGDEFVLVCPRRDDLDEGALAALTLRVEQAVEAPVVHDGQLLLVTASCGAVLAEPGEEPQSALDRADKAMYAAKRARGEQRRGPEAGARYPRWVAADVVLSASLASASREQRLDVHYQQVVDLATRRPVGAEALLRVTDRDGSPLPADRAVAVAEANGLIGRLGREVLERALEQAAQWKAALPTGADLAVGVNVSPLQLHDGALLGHVERALAATGLDASAVVLEVTESRLLPDTPAVQDALAGLRALGVHLAVDDFGTGYASAEYLASFPFDTVKVDGRYTRALLGDDPRMARLARGVFGLAVASGLVAVAEGVETEAEAEAVLGLGCTLAQGWLFGRAVPAGRLGHDLHAALGAAVPAPRRGLDLVLRDAP